MEKKHIDILKFLSKQSKPIKVDDFPNSITSDYNLGLKSGSLLFELGVVLKNKNWIENIGVDDFAITENGKTIIAPYLSNKSTDILDFLKPYGTNNFQDISPILSTMFLVDRSDLNELSEKAIAIRQLLYGMVNDGLIKLQSNDVNRLGNGNSGERDWLDNTKIIATMAEPSISQVTKNHIGNNNNNTTHGESSPIVGGDFIQELKKKDETINAMDEQLKAAQLALTLKQGDLTALQIKEAKNKKIYAILGVLGGSVVTLIIEYVKDKLTHV